MSSSFFGNLLQGLLKKAGSDAIFSFFQNIASTSAALQLLISHYRNARTELQALKDDLAQYDTEGQLMLEELAAVRQKQLSVSADTAALRRRISELEKVLGHAASVVSLYHRRCSTTHLLRQNMVDTHREEFAAFLQKNEHFTSIAAVMQTQPQLEKEVVKHLGLLLLACAKKDQELVAALPSSLKAEATGARRADDADPEQDPDASTAALAQDTVEESSSHAAASESRQPTANVPEGWNDAYLADIPGISHTDNLRTRLSATPSPDLDSVVKGLSSSEPTSAVFVPSLDEPPSPAAATTRRTSWSSVAQEAAQSENNYWLLQQIKQSAREAQERDEQILQAVQVALAEVMDAKADATKAAKPDTTVTATPSVLVSQSTVDGTSAAASERAAAALSARVVVQRVSLAIHRLLRQKAEEESSLGVYSDFPAVNARLKIAASGPVLLRWEAFAQTALSLVDKCSNKLQLHALLPVSPADLSGMAMLVTVLAQVHVVLLHSRHSSTRITAAMLSPLSDVLLRSEYENEERAFMNAMRAGFPMPVPHGMHRYGVMPRFDPFDLEDAELLLQAAELALIGSTNHPSPTTAAPAAAHATSSAHPSAFAQEKMFLQEELSSSGMGVLDRD